ncbi:MAG: hypothetical protein ACOCSN_04540, partial [Halanaeroarchaeum sp.]
MPALERLSAVRTGDFDLSFARSVRTLVRAESAVTNGRVVAKRIAANDALTGFHGFAVRDLQAGKPVT